MNYLLDTCVISELVRPRPSPFVLEWLAGVPEEHVYLSVVTLGEIRKGILRVCDARRARRLQTWLDGDVRLRFQGRILVVDEEVALEWGRICAAAETAGCVRPVVDALLAATALVNGLTLVTRNTADFAFTRTDVFNPWQ